MNPNTAQWVRMYKVPYRRQGRTLVRLAEVACETLKNGLHKPGERSCIPTDTLVTVQVVTAWFPAPKTPAEELAAETAYEKVEQAADDFVRTQFPDAAIVVAEPEADEVP